MSLKAMIETGTWAGVLIVCAWILIGAAQIGTAQAQTSTGASKLVSFDTPEQEALYEKLLQEYRCLKCQNQNLAGSHADLAGDLRDEIRDQIKAGRSGAEINDYLVARYGDFVLYKPRLKPSTYILWFGPFALLVIAGWYAVRVAKEHRAINSTPLDMADSDSVSKARSLLDD